MKSPTAHPTTRFSRWEDALIRLAVKDPVKVELVKLRYFAGLTTQEAAAILGLLTATGPRLSRNRAAPGPGRHLQESPGLAMSSRVPCFGKRTQYDPRGCDASLPRCTTVWHSL